MNGPNKDGSIWWEDEFYSKSASSNPWDSTPAVHQSEGKFQDYELRLKNYVIFRPQNNNVLLLYSKFIAIYDLMCVTKVDALSR